MRTTVAVVGRMAVGLAAILAVIVTSAATVDAHATLKSSNPASGSMLTEAPDTIELVFTESVGGPAALEVLDSSGDPVEATGDLQIVDTTMTRPYDPASFSSANYTISYQVTSADGHPISGTVQFMVHRPGEPIVTVPSGGGGSTGASTDADPATVLALVAALALALAIAGMVTTKLVTGLASGVASGPGRRDRSA